MVNNDLAQPERKTTLPFVLLSCLIRPFRSAILPRLFLIIFRYSQAVLINITIRFVSQNGKTSGFTTSTGYWLVLLAIVIYVGMAVSSFCNVSQNLKAENLRSLQQYINTN